jgi:hypothetical protein
LRRIGNDVSRAHRERVALLLALALVLPGCGGKAGWSDARCRGQARQLAVRAASMVRHYGGTTVYPADMSYLGFRDGLGLFEQGRCAPGELGTALRRELTAPQRATFLRLLPGKVAGKVRRALSS